MLYIVIPYIWAVTFRWDRGLVCARLITSILEWILGWANRRQFLNYNCFSIKAMVHMERWRLFWFFSGTFDLNVFLNTTKMNFIRWGMRLGELMFSWFYKLSIISVFLQFILAIVIYVHAATIDFFVVLKEDVLGRGPGWVRRTNDKVLTAISSNSPRSQTDHLIFLELLLRSGWIISLLFTLFPRSFKLFFYIVTNFVILWEKNDLWAEEWLRWELRYVVVGRCR